MKHNAKFCISLGTSFNPMVTQPLFSSQQRLEVYRLLQQGVCVSISVQTHLCLALLLCNFAFRFFFACLCWCCRFVQSVLFMEPGIFPTLVLPSITKLPKTGTHSRLCPTMNWYMFRYCRISHAQVCNKRPFIRSNAKRIPNIWTNCTFIYTVAGLRNSHVANNTVTSLWADAHPHSWPATESFCCKLGGQIWLTPDGILKVRDSVRPTSAAMNRRLRPLHQSFQ